MQSALILMKPIQISVIITTFNYPAALRQVLSGLAAQSDLKFDVVIADDGSDAETWQTIAAQRDALPYPIQHVWQPHRAFRAGTIRNQAVAYSSGDYLIFLDGDCIPRTDFIAQHRQLAKPGYFVAGHRVLLQEALTQRILTDEIVVQQLTLGDWWQLRRRRDCNRFLPHLSLPYWRHHAKKRWQGVKTCNLGVWRDDFIAVNGFDEAFIGWGYEDSDLALRLIRHQCYHRSGKFKTVVYHLWHPIAPRDQAASNWSRFQDRCQNTQSGQAIVGINQYINLVNTNEE